MSILVGFMWKWAPLVASTREVHKRYRVCCLYLNFTIYLLRMGIISRVSTEPTYPPLEDKVLVFINALSDPVLLLNSAGMVYAKNDAFKKHDSHVSLNSSSFNELSHSLKSAFQEYDFPLPHTAQLCRSIMQDQVKRQHAVSLYPFVFADTHIVIFHPCNNEDVLQRVLDCIPARVFWKDLNGKFLGGNHLFVSDCGMTSKEELTGLCDYDVFPKDEADNFTASDRDVIASGQPMLNIEEPQTRADGEINWVQTSKVPIRNYAQEVIGVMGSYTDITERKLYQELIEGQARRDQLTKLHNRQALQEHLQKLEQDKEKKCGALLFIDLDNFKTVNDTLGHAIGDELLKIVSSRIKEVTEKNDFIVRLGGDEFAVLLISDSKQEALVSVAYKLADDIKNIILKPYMVDSNFIQLGVSIGITYFDSKKIDWTNTFNEADMAMYDAKASGKNTIKVFSEELRSSHNRIYKMQTMLGRAIENDEFYLNIQPQFNAEEKIIGAEALIRWNNKELGEVSPVDFIPLCEQSGSIHEIGMWVFEQAFRIVSSLSEKYEKGAIPPLAINVSAKQFQRKGFLADVKNLLKKNSIAPNLIHLELTESLLVESEVDSIDQLKALKELGFPLAIDDFGTGYSCLSYLSQLPIDKIKIDKSFTFNVIEDKRQAAIADTIITMAKNLDMNVIAEGLETKEQLEFLLSHGCFEFQGYYFSRPVSEKDYIALLDARQ